MSFFSRKRKIYEIVPDSPSDDDKYDDVEHLQRKIAAVDAEIDQMMSFHHPTYLLVKQCLQELCELRGAKSLERRDAAAQFHQLISHQVNTVADGDMFDDYDYIRNQLSEVLQERIKSLQDDLAAEISENKRRGPRLEKRNKIFDETARKPLDLAGVPPSLPYVSFRRLQQLPPVAKILNFSWKCSAADAAEDTYYMTPRDRRPAQPTTFRGGRGGHRHLGVPALPPMPSGPA